MQFDPLSGLLQPEDPWEQPAAFYQPAQSFKPLSWTPLEVTTAGGAGGLGVGKQWYGRDALRSAITIHAKIEYRTDPDEFRKWRINLHYEALTGRNDTAYKLLLQAASCGMCEVAKNKCRYNEVTSPDPFDIFKKMTGYVPTP